MEEDGSFCRASCSNLDGYPGLGPILSLPRPGIWSWERSWLRTARRIWLRRAVSELWMVRLQASSVALVILRL